MYMDIWELTSVRTSPTPRGPIPGTLEDPDEGSRVHPVGDGHRKKKRVVTEKKRVVTATRNYIIPIPRGNGDFETILIVEIQLFGKATHV